MAAVFFSVLWHEVQQLVVHNINSVFDHYFS
jgi:hypothetical protein